MWVPRAGWARVGHLREVLRAAAERKAEFTESADEKSCSVTLGFVLQLFRDAGLNQALQYAETVCHSHHLLGGPLRMWHHP